MKKSIFTAIIIMAFSIQSYAGFVSLTIHSRANCVNNESITWDLWRAYKLITVSDHFRDNDTFIHEENTGLHMTRRSAAVHWNEAPPGSGWHVIGTHWMMDKKKGVSIFLGSTNVYDCSIYSGWW